MKCHNCQKQIDNDAKFCNFCGAAFEKHEENEGSVDLYFRKKGKKELISALGISSLMILVPLVIVYFTGVLYWGVMLIGALVFVGSIYYTVKDRFSRGSGNRNSL